MLNSGAASLMIPRNCVVCHTQPRSRAPMMGRPDIEVLDCNYCGKYAITGTAESVLGNPDHEGQLYLLSGVLRNSWDSGKPLTVTTDNIQSLIEAAPTWRTPLEVFDPVLQRVVVETKGFSDIVRVRFTEYPKFYWRTIEDLEFVLLQLRAIGRISDVARQDGFWTARLTLQGWERIEAARATTPDSSQAFVAMWFHESLNDAWNLGFRPAIIDAGYVPMRIDTVQHNERIDDRIVAEIRRSGLLVADFTGNRGGVYFEAGLALGLHIPVIWCCREDVIDQVHFDTRQYNHITWKDEHDLRTRLTDRIRATAPRTVA